MIQTQKEIESWIKPYATIVGESIEVDKALRESEPTKYFLRLTLPNNFEKYGIVLHSFWINHNIPDGEIQERKNEDEDLPEEDFIRINWKKFHELKGLDFDLNQAVIFSLNWWNKGFTQMNNELYAGGAVMDKEHLESLSDIILELYGDPKIEVFYNFLSTIDCNENKMFEGRISELIKLLDYKKLNFTPSLIYAKDGSWVVNTGYDLAFTMIGGKAELIDQLVKNNPDEIYEVEY